VSRTKDVKRELETVYEAVEALDRDRAAGRLGPEEHARQRAERERAAGALFVTLRRAQRERAEHDAPARRGAPAARQEPPAGWRRSPLVIVPAAGLLLAAGIGAGVAVERWIGGEPGAHHVTPAGAPPTTSGDVLGSLMSGAELQALREVAARDDAPIATLLQVAHVALDEGRLGEARRVYERVLAREPRNAEAITHIGGVLFQEGRVDEALARVEEALRIDPGYLHAHWDRAQFLFHGKRDYAAAVKAAEAFLEVLPEGSDADAIRRLMAEARAQEVQAAPVVPRAR
jgi:tetratricopeptide (TPR) repeat protein